MWPVILLLGAKLAAGDGGEHDWQEARAVEVVALDRLAILKQPADLRAACRARTSVASINLTFGFIRVALFGGKADARSADPATFG